MKNIMLIIILLTLIEGFTFITKANANDCPKYQLAKRYREKQFASPLTTGTFNSAGFLPFKLKRLTSNEYLHIPLPGNNFPSYLVTEDCGKVSFNYSFLGSQTCEDGITYKPEFSYECDGFLKSNKIVSGTCTFSWIYFCAGDLMDTLIEDVVSFKWQPVR